MKKPKIINAAIKELTRQCCNKRVNPQTKVTMKATDLRIGNWVERLFEGESTGIMQCTIIAIWDITKLDECEPSVFSFQPIPLTAEWLERLGFVGRADFMWKGIVGIQIKEGKYYLALKDLSNVIFHSVVEIEYVHTLQNAWHLFTGTELTVNASPSEK